MSAVDPVPVARESSGPEAPAGLESSGPAADLVWAQHLIVAADLAATPAERYLGAHRAAQQVAMVAVATSPVSRRSARQLRAGPVNLWTALAVVAPECGEWASYFAATQHKRAAVAAGAVALVSQREADDLVRDAQAFHDQVERRLRRRLAHQQAVAAPRPSGTEGPA